MKKLIILFAIALFIGCAGTKKTVTQTKQKVETLTEISEIKLDTTIFIPEENASLFIPIENTKLSRFKQPKVFIQKKGRAKVTVKIDSLGISATSNCDSIAKKVQFYEKKFKELKKEVTELKQTVKEKNGYSFFELILYMIASAIVSFVTAYLLKTFKIL